MLIEKPACGGFLPIVDGGYSLQYSPLMEYRREGNHLLLPDGRLRAEERDPAAERLVRNIINYVSAWRPTPRGRALYVGDPAGKSYLAGRRVGVRPRVESGRADRC